jgi:hypothetical protein
MNATSSPAPTPIAQQILKKLDEILTRLTRLEADVDQIDRTMRPCGDGHRRPR